ncbi:MAG: hypothetical protein U9P82_04820 [Bacteroidota bacterium]|nr:hypothetical protein [Bacteroidota bacterium]
MPDKDRRGLWKSFRIKKKYEETVFIRDNLDLSLSLSEHMDNEGNRTHLGELEYQAKYNSSSKARIKISNQIIQFLENTPYYKDCQHICAIPSSKLGKLNLPMRITNRISLNSNFIDLSSELKWKTEKNQLKKLSFKERWKELEETNIEIVLAPLNHRTEI